MSNYEKQGFVSGQVLTAAQLNHIEDGIEKILPAIEGKEGMQLIINSEGNLVWEEKDLTYSEQEILVFDNVSFKAEAGTQTISAAGRMFFIGQEYILYINGTKYTGEVYKASVGGMSISTGSFTLTQLGPDTVTNLFNNTGVAGTFSLYVKDKVYKIFDENYLPVSIRKGTGDNALVLNYIDSTNASGKYSVAANTGVATGSSAFAINSYSSANGSGSFASGVYSTANGTGSHVEGFRTIASGQYQHVEGKYNIEDTENKYVHIVGKGTNMVQRSNAYTLDWSGNGWFAGDVESNSVIVKSSTEGSNKRFKITVDDSGTISATEVTA